MTQDVTNPIPKNWQERWLVDNGKDETIPIEDSPYRWNRICLHKRDLAHIGRFPHNPLLSAH
jgi:hypothetical protein